MNFIFKLRVREKGGPLGGPGPWTDPNLQSELPPPNFIFKLRTREKFQERKGVAGTWWTRVWSMGVPPNFIFKLRTREKFQNKIGAGRVGWISDPKGAPWAGNSNSYVWVTQVKETQLPFHGPKGVPGGLGNS